MAIRKTGLGKGLGALIGETQSETDSTRVIELDINLIAPNPNQPRKFFDGDALHELADSIQQVGIIQPILVKKEGEFYTIIAGERRYRAARLVRLETIPAIVRTYDEMMTMQIALMENLQRTDLNPIEEAECFKRLIDEFGLTHEELGEKLGKSRSYITNSLRLLQLDPEVRDHLIEGNIFAGHAKLLLGIEDTDLQVKCCENIIMNELSVRDAEKMINDIRRREEAKNEKKPPQERNTAYGHIENELMGKFGTRVRVIQSRGKYSGKIELEYTNMDDLDRIYLLLRKI